MSQENVDHLIEAMEAYNRVIQNPDALDASALTEWLAMLDPEIRFEPQQSALEGGYIGHAGATQWLADMGAHFKEGEVRLADVRGHEGGALALGTLRCTARRSGIETELPVAIVASFRDGLVTKLRDYGDKEAALEAVGLSE
jgi:ketosteroid isomerase-like protein